MPFNHLRANIRNAMVGMTVSEAVDFAVCRNDKESSDYANEFVQELRDEFNDGEPFR